MNSKIRTPPKLYVHTYICSVFDTVAAIYSSKTSNYVIIYGNTILHLRCSVYSTPNSENTEQTDQKFMNRVAVLLNHVQ